MSPSRFSRKGPKQAMLEAIMNVEVTLSMMKVKGITIKESDGGFMSSLWDIYCRPSYPGKVRIFWAAVVDSGDGTMAVKEMEERFCSNTDPAQIAYQFVDLLVSVVSRFARQRVVDVIAEAQKTSEGNELTIDQVRKVNEALPGPR